MPASSFVKGDRVTAATLWWPASHRRVVFTHISIGFLMAMETIPSLSHERKSNFRMETVRVKHKGRI
jgi:hypothetical protein